VIETVFINPGERVMATTDIDLVAKVDEIVSKYPGGVHDIISILQDVQQEFNYIPKEMLIEITKKLGMPLSRAYALATFFSAFSLEPKGEHPISVCLGTACHVRGAPRLVEQLERELKIKEGETTPDGKFSLGEVHCLGCCGLAPVITVGGDLYGKVNVGRIKSILKKY
jgi:NADH:ubiquinone oxidoreductase subunit E